MVFRKKISPEAELANLESEREYLEKEVAARRKLQALKTKVKEDKKTLKQLRSELHPSIYSKFGRFLVKAGSGAYHVTKAGAAEYEAFHNSLQKEKAHVSKRKKVLRQIS